MVYDIGHGNDTEFPRNDVVERLKAMDPIARRCALQRVIYLFSRHNFENIEEKIDLFRTYMTIDVVEHNGLGLRLYLGTLKIVQVVLNSSTIASKILDSVFGRRAAEDVIRAIDVVCMCNGPDVSKERMWADLLTAIVKQGSPIEIALRYAGNIRTPLIREAFMYNIAVTVARRHGCAAIIEILEEYLPRDWHFRSIFTLLRCISGDWNHGILDAHILLENYDESELVEGSIRDRYAKHHMENDLIAYYMKTRPFEEVLEKARDRLAGGDRDSCMAIIHAIAAADASAALSLVPQLPEELKDDARASIVLDGNH